IATSLAIAGGNTLEGVVGAYLVNRFANGRDAFQRARDIFRFAFFAALFSTTVSATVGLPACPWQDLRSGRTSRPSGSPGGWGMPQGRSSSRRCFSCGRPARARPGRVLKSWKPASA
ncbi:MAG TPA: MASE1 domain-containing protein, partial [bacterium]|nr:MASE1 domain-containing protein [bacterium]